MLHDLRRDYFSGNLDNVELPCAGDLTAVQARDLNAAFAESVWLVKRDAPELPRHLRTEKLGVPFNRSPIPFPTSARHLEEIGWALKAHQGFPLQHPRYRTSKVWRPAAERRDFQNLLCAFVETGNRWKLAPIIFSRALSLPENRAEFADALRCRLDISAEQLRRIVAALATGAPRNIFDAIDALGERKRRNADGSLARGGRRARAICLGPTRSEYRDYARSLSSKTGIPVQSIEKDATAVGALRPRGKINSRSQP